MRQHFDLLPGLFAPVLSLDTLRAGLEGGPERFEVIDSGPSPDVQLEYSQAVRAVDAFVESLPTRDREIVRSVFWDCQSQSQVAARLKVSKMAITKALHRIHARARVALVAHQHLAPVN